MIKAIQHFITGGGAFCSMFLMVILSGSAIAQNTKMLLLGDSITQGFNAGQSGPYSGFRDDLYSKLVSQEVSFDFVGGLSEGSFADPDHEGHDGFTAPQIDNNINDYLSSSFLPGDSKMVLLHIGTNDIATGVTPATIMTSITSIVDKIYQFDNATKIMVSGITPRTDAKNAETGTLNDLIHVLVESKKDDNYEIFYVGHYEVFLTLTNWENTHMSDAIHPNDAGYTLMASAYFNAITTALNGNASEVTDNFTRPDLEPTWTATSDISIINGELANTATDSTWNHLAVYVQERNPDRVSFEYGSGADFDGISNVGLALRLDNPTSTASGYLVWFDGNNVDLWTIENGVPSQAVTITSTSLLAPQAGDVMKVVLGSSPSSHFFDLYINDVLYGRVEDNDYKGARPLIIQVS